MKKIASIFIGLFLSVTMLAQSTDSVVDQISKTDISSITNHLDLFYSVQIGNFRKELKSDVLAPFDKVVTVETRRGSTRYLAGVFPDINSCVETKRMAHKKGFEDAFITAYYKGEKITMVEAEKIRLGENK